MPKYEGMLIREIIREINKLDDSEIIEEMFEYPEIYEQVNEYLLDKKKRRENRKRVADKYSAMKEQ